MSANRYGAAPGLLSLLALGACIALGVVCATAQSAAGPRDPAAVAQKTSQNEERTLAAILEEGRLRVAELAAALRGVSDTAQRAGVERRIADARTETRLQYLHARRQFAQARGDTRAVAEITDAIEAILHPQALAPAPVEPPEPAVPAPPHGESP